MPISVNPFAFSETTLNNPSVFQVRFYLDGIVYRYGFAVTRCCVVEEWLLENEKLLFHRRDKKFQLNAFPEGEQLFEKTRDNALLLSVCAQNNGRIASSVIRFFRNSIILTGFYNRKNFLFLKDAKKRNIVLEFMRHLDINIVGVEYSDDFIATTHYQIGDKTYCLDMREESEGIQKLFSLFGHVLDALEHGKLLIVDDFDAGLHPLVVRYIVKLFCSPQNKKGAQLIITTHNTYLLKQNFLSLDQFWFTGKESPESKKKRFTELISLANYDIRSNVSYEKDYLDGRYGYIPELPVISLRDIDGL